jgi:cytochrome o ubiquinol oxidase subunit 1
MRVFDDPSLQPYFIVAAGRAADRCRHRCHADPVASSIRKRDQLRDETGDPWGGRTLEWSTSSPPPAYNFAFTPIVHDLDAWADMKPGVARPVDGFRPIHMPKNTGAGVILAISTVFGFA